MSVRISKNFRIIEDPLNSKLNILELFDEDAQEWMGAEFKVSGETLKVGDQINISDYANIFGFDLNKETDKYYLPLLTKIDSSTGTELNGSVQLAGEEIEIIPVPDFDTDISAVLDPLDNKYKITQSIVGSANAFIWSRILRLGATKPTAPVSYTVWEDTDDSDINKRLFRQVKPVSEFTPLSEGDEFEYRRGIPAVVDLGSNFFIEIASDDPFSVQGNSSNVPYAKFEAQITTRTEVLLDKNLSINSDTTHESNSNYFVNTTGGGVTITVPDGVVSCFHISDSDKNFNTNNCVIDFQDDEESTLYTVTLDRKNKSYYFFYDGTNWNYTEAPQGYAVAITANKTASTDFIDIGGYLGEVRMFGLSISNAVTKASLQKNGWAICDGTTPAAQSISSPIITTTPNLEEKFIRMSDDETSGTTGGAATHTLTIDEMPEHTHQIDCSTAASVGSTNTARCGQVNGGTITTTTSGSGDPHNNLPPFYELVYFIKVK